MPRGPKNVLALILLTSSVLMSGCDDDDGSQVAADAGVGMDVQGSDAMVDQGVDIEVQSDVPDATVNVPIAEGIYELAGVDPDLPSDELAVLDAVVSSAEIVGMGESAHLSNSYLRVRVRMTRYLIEEHGFRVVGLESPRTAAEEVDAYLRSCEGDPAGLARDNLHGIWQAPELVAFLQWLCAYNTDHPDDPVSLIGFDVTLGQAFSDAEDLVAFVETTSPADQAAAITPGINACSLIRQPSQHDQYAECTAALDATEEYLEANEAEIVAATSATAFGLAQISAISLRGAVGRAYLDQRRGPADLLSAWGARDLALGEIVLRMREVVLDGARMVLWAHNSHISRGTNGTRTILAQAGIEASWDAMSMGDHLETALGEQYVAIGTSSHSFVDAEASYPLPPAPEGVELPYLSDLVLEVAQGKKTLFLDLNAMTSPQAVLSPDREVILRSRNSYQEPSDLLHVTAPQAWFDAMIWVEEALCNEGWFLGE